MEYNKNANVNVNISLLNSQKHCKKPFIGGGDENLRSLSSKKGKPNRSDKGALQVELVQPENFRKLARTLQIAFAQDKFAQYLTEPIESPKLKEQVDLALFESSVYTSILDGLVVAIRDVEEEAVNPDLPYLAVACFIRPDYKSNYWKMVKSGYLKIAWLANKECRRRVFQEQYPLLTKCKQQVLGSLDDEAWYLSDIGTTPNARGKGCARKLLEYVYDNYIDINGEICYLESSHPRNRGIYEKLGFTYIKTVDVGHVNCDCDSECEEKPLRMDLMVRGEQGSRWRIKSWDKLHGVCDA